MKMKVTGYIFEDNKMVNKEVDISTDDEDWLTSERFDGITGFTILERDDFHKEEIAVIEFHNNMLSMW